MSTFVFIMLLIFIGAPLAKGLSTRMARGSGDRRLLEETKALRDRLEQSEVRLASNEDRLESLEERLQFYERLLGDPAHMKRLRSALAAGSPSGGAAEEGPANRSERSPLLEADTR